MESNGTEDETPGSRLDATDDLKTLPVAEVEKRLGSSPDGLTQVEADRRMTQYGPNEIVEEQVDPLLTFLTYFWGPIPWMIEAAVVLSGVLEHWPDFFIILVLLVANAGIGFGEERQAGRAIVALKAELAIKARVDHAGRAGRRRGEAHAGRRLGGRGRCLCDRVVRGAGRARAPTGRPQRSCRGAVAGDGSGTDRSPGPRVDDRRVDEATGERMRRPRRGGGRSTHRTWSERNNPQWGIRAPGDHDAVRT